MRNASGSLEINKCGFSEFNYHRKFYFRVLNPMHFFETLRILLKSLEELLCENKRFRFIMKLKHSKFLLFFVMKKRLHSHLEMKLNDEEKKKKKGRHSHSIHSTIQTNCSLNLFQFMRTKSIANWHTTVNGLIRFSNYPQIRSRFSRFSLSILHST